MINISNLEKYYDDTKVLNGINLDINEGAIFGIAGRSGTGKSTLLRCINGLEKYTKGSLKVGEIELSDLNNKELRNLRKKLGMVFQNFSLLSRLSVYENIALPMRCWHYDKETIDKKVNELLDVVGLSQKSKSKAKDLSGGQKQRVAIARALTLDPKILLCDEATSALDPKSTQSILELLKEINQKYKITIIVVTHEMSVLRSICDNVAILEDGIVKAKGTVEDIFRTRPEALQNLLGSKSYNVPKGGKNIEILYSKENGNQPIISNLARDLNIEFSIVGGDMESFKGNSVSSIVINIKNDEAEIVGNYLTNKDITWNYICASEGEELSGNGYF